MSHEKETENSRYRIQLSRDEITSPKRHQMLHTVYHENN